MEPTVEKNMANSRDISFAHVEVLMLRWRRWLIGVPLGTAIVTALLILFHPRQYTTTVSFIPVVQSSSRALSGLAQQFGINVPGQDPMASPAFYADLITTPALLSGLAQAPYRINGGESSQAKSFVDLAEVDGRDSGERLA